MGKKKEFPPPAPEQCPLRKELRVGGGRGWEDFPALSLQGGLRGLRCHFGRSWTRPTGAQDPSRQARRWPGDAGPEGVAFREIPSPLFPSVEGEGRQPALNAGGEAGSYGAVLRRKPQCADRPAGVTEQFFGGFIAALFATGGGLVCGSKGVANARHATEKFFGGLS